MREKMMSNKLSKASNQEAKADQQAQKSVENVSAEQTEKNSAVNETVTASQFDPKKTKHGVDYCCGSCGG